MKEKELRKLVDDALALHREIAAKSERLKQIKAALVVQAVLSSDAQVPTDSGGRRWVAEGSDGSIARVSFPVPGVIGEIEPETPLMRQIQAIAGDKFRQLFEPVKKFKPVDDFRVQVAVLLPAKEARTMTAICVSEGATRVSFETAKKVEEPRGKQSKPSNSRPPTRRDRGARGGSNES
jgi:hypothetical protein